MAYKEKGQPVREKVEAALETIRPILQNDGGDIELIDVDEATGLVTVSLQGACAGCPHAAITLKNGVEARLKQAIPEVTGVVNQPR